MDDVTLACTAQWRRAVAADVHRDGESHHQSYLSTDGGPSNPSRHGDYPPLALSLHPC